MRLLSITDLFVLGILILPDEIEILVLILVVQIVVGQRCEDSRMVVQVLKHLLLVLQALNGFILFQIILLSGLCCLLFVDRCRFQPLLRNRLFFLHVF